MRCKRGITLAETCVTLALVALLGTMIVSFCAVTKRSSSLIDDNVRVSADLDAVNEMFRGWTSYFDRADCVFSVDGDRLLSVTDGDGRTFSCRFSESDGAFRASLPDAPDNKRFLSKFKDIRFSIAPDGKTVICYADYLKHEGQSDQSDETAVICAGLRSHRS